MAEMVVNEGAPPEVGWQLSKGARMAALQELKSTDPAQTQKRLIAALHANPDRDMSKAQIMLERVIAGNVPAFDALAREDLSALVAITEWLTGILDGLPPPEAVARAASRAELLYPARQLAEAGFVGREEELQRLADHVGIQPVDVSSGFLGGLVSYGRRIAAFAEERFEGRRKGLFLHGPGGVGKSTLLSRFVLDHTATESYALPFALLDVDKPSVEPLRPLTFLVEALGQLQYQLEGLSRPARELSNKILDSLESRETAALESIVDVSSDLVFDFAKLVNPQLADRPLLFVVDTFEEVQYLGSEVVYLVGNFLEQLQRAVPQIRLVLSGRVPPAGSDFYNVAVAELPSASAADLVVRTVKTLGASPPAPRLVDELVDQLGGNPMVLRLAARLITQDDFEGVRRASAREWLQRVRVEALQARLYGRVLAHLHSPDLKKLALPGLVVRRITAELIMEVLAEPCGLEISDIASAEDLIGRMAMEVALVERDANDGFLRYRSDIRRIMLDTLSETVPPETSREIDRRAAQFWRSRSGPIASAEVLYHLMRLEAPREELERHWDDNAKSMLRGALGELPDGSRIWLANKLGISVSDQTRTNAVQEDWEQHAGRAARRLLENGQALQALVVLHERPDRLDGSPLYALEARALYAVDRLYEALDVANKGLSSIEHSDAPNEVDLRLLVALIMERGKDLYHARDQAQAAAVVAAAAGVRLPHLRAVLRVLRIERTINPYSNEYRLVQRQGLELLHSIGFDRLIKDAALLCDAAAELGDTEPELLEIAINQIGIDILRNAPRDLIQEILQAGDRSRSDVNRVIRGDSRELAKLALDAISNELHGGKPNEGIRRLAVQAFQQASDRAVQRISGDSSNDETLARRSVPKRLKGAQRTALQKLILQYFSPPTFRETLLIYLKREVEGYTPQGLPFGDTVMNVISAAEKQGWLADLVVAIQKARPDDAKLASELDKIFAKKRLF